MASSCGRIYPSLPDDRYSSSKVCTKRGSARPRLAFITWPTNHCTTLSFPARGLQALEYEARDYSNSLLISISFGSDGVVREVMSLRQSAP